MTLHNQAAFWDRIADRYSAKPVPDEAIYQRKLEITRRHMDKTKTVLEIGCGTGSTAIAHAPFVKHILATDISPQMILIARKKARAADARNVDFATASFDHLPKPAVGHDLVMAMSVLHLLPDLAGTLEKIRARLKPGGLLVTTTPCLGDLPLPIRALLRLGSAMLGRLGLFPRLNVFTAEEFELAMVEAGFVFEELWEPNPGRDLFVVARR